MTPSKPAALAPPEPHSLRTRLLVSLLAAIVVVGIVQAAMAYRTALAQADEIFDYHMQQMALSLRAGLPESGAIGRRSLEPTDISDEFVVQVWSDNGVQIFQSAGRVALPQRAILGFADIPARGTMYRVFSIQTGSQVVQVAQDMAVRRQMARTLALRTISSIALVAPLLMLIVWWVVRRSMIPVARVQHQLAQRRADDLTEVSETGLPLEIRPLVHELNELIVRVRQAFDAQRHFVADAAHELRSPLAALKLQVQGLQRAGDDAARETSTRRLAAGIDRASRLVEQLLVLARQQSTPASGVAAQAVSLAPLVRQCVAEASAAASAAAIDLGLGHADDAQVQGYADALAILLRNLLDNAIKYTPAGGSVDVEIHQGADGTRLTVEDSGPGIAAEDRERVLGRFYRLPGSQATGSGLGLAIVKSVADLHDARITLDRSARLGGLQVTVHFAPPTAKPTRELRTG